MSTGFVRRALAIAALLSFATAGAETPLTGLRLAVTVDDLPANGDLLPGSTRLTIARGVLAALRRNGVPQAYGFANGHDLAREPALREILVEWRAAGYPVGNHGFGHADLHAVALADYVDEIDRMDGLLASILPSQPPAERRVYRYPFLNEGDTLAKRTAVREYLSSRGYRLAHVTTDYYDWAWNAAYNRCRLKTDATSIAWLTAHVREAATGSLRASKAMAHRLFGRDVPQILLVHVGDFDAVTLDDILAEIRAQGATFVPLDEALRDPVFAADPGFPSSIGLTFFEQVAASRGVEIGDLQETPYTLRRLDRICPAS